MAGLRGVWRFLMGVKDALALLFLLLFFGLLWAAVAFRGPAVKVPDGAALVITLDGTLVDQATPVSALAALDGGRLSETEARDVIRAIDLAAKDRRIKALVLDLDTFLGGGLANLEGVGKAILRFKAEKKPVYAYATAYGDDGWFLAAHADEAWLNPNGAVLLTGPGGTGLYLKGALDKLKVDVEVFRVGTFKSAIEPFTRENASPEARAADQMLADDLWAAYQAGIRRARPAFDVKAAVESMPARIKGLNGDLATLAKDMGFVDRVGTKLAFVARVRETVGAGDEPDRADTLNGIGQAAYLATAGPEGAKGDVVALVQAAGPITDGEAPEGQAGSESVADLIEQAVADERVKALVLRIDSPGGSATASDVIRDALMAARARGKPVVASMGPVAASGGYWIATGAERIYAEPSTITGSIGVFGLIPTFGRTLKDLGITSDGVGTTPYSRQPNLIDGLNEPARDLVQTSVEDVYRRFLGVVAEARKMDVSEVAPIAEGRVWSGSRAVELRLVDALGGLDAAVAEAGRLAGIKGEVAVKPFRQPRPWFETLLEQRQFVRAKAGGDALGRLVLAQRLKAAGALAASLEAVRGPTVQAACLACAGFRPLAAAEQRRLDRALAALGLSG
ncbi:signal peptide peptidase SppA [Thermaurantiacus tibetensis]|uniref:signal peptide peptidase SppA n=1 Tax=Thermaurantiacus tibetensis TaxID=2759035 RepID=UPI0018905524|nr:signal peptide peptidase SppA [Thermaurantiacus tibetensis]